MTSHDHYYLVGGVQAPPGGATIATAVDLIPYSVTEGQVISPSSDGQWYKITTSLGVPTLRLNVTADLSYNMATKVDTSDVFVDLYTANTGSPTTLADLDYVDGAALGREWTLNDATTYYFNFYPVSIDVMLFVRTSDWGPHTDWVQADDVTYTTDFSGDDLDTVSSGGSLTADSGTYVPSTPNIYDVGGVGSLSHKTIAVGGTGPQYNGNYELDHGFGMSTYPGTDASAIQCLWKHARKGHFGLGNYWSNDGSAGGGEPPTCVWTNSGQHAGDTYTDYPVGISFSNHQKDASTGGGHQTIDQTSYGTSTSLNLNRLLLRFDHLTGFDAETDLAPLPDGWTTGDYEAESEAPTLTTLEARGIIMDQGSIGVDGDGSPFWCLYVLGGSGYFDDGSTWGPKQPYFDGVHPGTSTWAGAEGEAGPQEPGTYADDADVQVGVGVTWTEIDSSLWAAGLAVEEAWELDTSGNPNWPGAFQFGCISGLILTDTVPFSGVRADPSSGGTLTVDMKSTLNTLVYRVTLRPPRLRWIGSPGLPTVVEVELPGPVLTGTPDDLRRRFT